MSEEQSITLIPKKRGRPLGSKNKPHKAKSETAHRKLKGTPKMHNPDKVSSFAIGVSSQHYWLISALAEARSVSRMVALEGIINKFVATLGDQTK